MKDDAARRAWLGAMTLIAMTSLASAVAVIARRVEYHNATSWQWLQLLAVDGVLVVALVATRRRPGVVLGDAAFLACTASLILGLWISQAELAASGKVWAAFQGHKLTVLAIALLPSGELWVTLLAIGAVGAAAIVQMALFSPAELAFAAVGEPWAVSLHAVIAAILAVQRRMAFAASQRMIHAEAEATALERHARDLRAVSDLANTPLQTLELEAAYLRRSCPETAPHFDRMARAIERLKELNRVLSEHERHVTWQPGDESVDSTGLLERRRAQTLPPIDPRKTE